MQPYHFGQKWLLGFALALIYIPLRTYINVPVDVWGTILRKLPLFGIEVIIICFKHAENLCNGIRLSHVQSIPNWRDGQTIDYCLNQITFEATHRPASHVKLVRASIEMIVTILAGNNFESKKTEGKTSRQILTDHMIDYLQNELHQNKSIRVPEFLLRFNVSEEVANLCILNQNGMSLRNFIFKYKSDLFKSRMLKVDVLELSHYVRRH